MTENNKDMLLAAYLINGEDELKRETVVKRLKERIAKHSDLSFNYDEFQGMNASGSDIVAACNTMPFASDTRLVLVMHADQLKKADAEAVVEYLGQPNESTVLALVAEKLAKGTRLYKAVAAVGKNSVIDCSPLKRHELPKAVRAMAVGHGITLTDGAIRALIDRTGEGTVRIDGELRKLALDHRGNDPVTEHEVTSSVAQTAEVKPWEFVDAFSARNTAKCLLCLQRMDSVSPHALIAMCATRLRELICARSLYERGNPQALASTLKVPDWRVKNHVAWARGFTAEELRRALTSSARTEKAMKSGADPGTAFLDWILAVVPRSE